MSRFKLRMGVYWHCKPDETDERFNMFLGKSKVQARKIQDFWRYVSNDTWDVRCEGFAFRSSDFPKPPRFCKDDVLAVDTGDFEPTHWHIISTISYKYCGQGVLGGNWSVNYTQQICGTSTSTHEGGHNKLNENKGLHHDGIRFETGKEKEYGSSSLMGASRIMHGLSSPHRVNLGLETERETLHVDHSQQILIAPTEMSKHVLHENEWQNIVILKAQSLKYYLSLHKAVGIRYPVGGAGAGLFIHEWDRRNDTHIKLLSPLLQVGEERTLPNGVVIKYHEYNKETARVSILFDDGVEVVDLEMPHGPPVTLESSRIDESHSGAWYNHNYDGQGFDLMVVDNDVVAYNYAFEQDGSHRQRYYMGTGKIKDGACVMDWWTTEGGSFNNPAQHKKIKVGKAQIFLNDDNTGVFHFHTTEHGRGAVNITNIAKMSPSRFNGSWYHPERDGEGLAIQQFRDIPPDGTDQINIYWWTWGRGNIQKWYWVSGATPDNLLIREIKGGRWLFYDDVEKPVIGIASIVLTEGETSDKDRVLFKYNSKWLGEGQRDMGRLFG